MRASFLLMLAAALALGAGGVSAAGYKVPRTASGRPDLQGQWTNASLTHLERQRDLPALVITEAQASAYEARQDGAPAIPGDDVSQGKSEWWEQGGKLGRVAGQVRTSWLIDPADGQLPYNDEGRRNLQRSMAGLLADFDGPEARPAAERCLMGSGGVTGPPMLNTGYNNNYQIVQTADHLVVLAEMVHDARIIPLRDPRRLPAQIHQWMGNGIGRWDGDTLVVETTNFPRASAWRSPTRLYMSAQARVTERFTRISADEIRYEFTVDDPATFARPWRAEMALRRASAPMYEFACHEGNYSLAGVLAGGRQKDREAAASR
jgi:hypothetical protein